jgi:hypothetical protein
LGKQRVESLQIRRALHVPGYGWRHHPVVKMWRGHDEALVSYTAAICGEWRRRGFTDTCLAKLVDEAGIEPRPQAELRAEGLLPPWLGRRSLHRAYQSVLVRKDPDWYRRHFPTVADDLEIVWPVT